MKKIFRKTNNIRIINIFYMKGNNNNKNIEDNKLYIIF